MNRQCHLARVAINALEHTTGDNTVMVRNPIYTHVNKGKSYPYNSVKRGHLPSVSSPDLICGPEVVPVNDGTVSDATAPVEQKS